MVPMSADSPTSEGFVPFPGYRTWSEESAHMPRLEQPENLRGVVGGLLDRARGGHA